ncbi:hypothetical protein D5282_25460 [bacterium 1xD8-48]|nr:hypothetical protein [bacterium 1xD8-48]
MEKGTRRCPDSQGGLLDKKEAAHLARLKRHPNKKQIYCTTFYMCGKEGMVKKWNIYQCRNTQN